MHERQRRKRDGGTTYCLNNIVNQLFGFVNLLFGICHDETVQVLFLVAGVGSVRTALALLHGALSTNGNLGARFCFHLLECIATRTDKQANLNKEELSVSIVIMEAFVVRVRSFQHKQLARHEGNCLKARLHAWQNTNGGGGRLGVRREFGGLVIILKLISG